MRLPDWAYSDSELAELDIDMITGDRYNSTEIRSIVWYKLYKDGRFINKAMLLVVDDAELARSGLVRLLSSAGLVVEIEAVGAGTELDAMMIAHVLRSYRYRPTTKFPGNDRVFRWEEWMSKLI